MPEFTVTVFCTTSREVVVRARGYKDAGKKAIKAVEGKVVETNTQELEGVEVMDEARTEVRWFEPWGDDGELVEEDSTLSPS